MDPYTKLSDESIKYNKKILTDIFEYQNFNLSKLRILDIGSGSGGWTIASAIIAKKGYLYGIEPSDSMLKDARNNKKIFIPKLNNIKFFKGNGINLHFKNENQFDVILYMKSLHNMNKQDATESLNLSKNLLKKKGIILFRFPIWDKDSKIKIQNDFIRDRIKLIEEFASVNKFKFLKYKTIYYNKPIGENKAIGFLQFGIKKTN